MPTATAELAKAAFLQAAHQTASRDYEAHARANGYTIWNPIGREETAESMILFSVPYEAAFGPDDRAKMLAGLEGTGA